MHSLRSNISLAILLVCISFKADLLLRFIHFCPNSDLEMLKLIDLIFEWGFVINIVGFGKTISFLDLSYLVEIRSCLSLASTSRILISI
jgi:hypothetical protein